MKPYPSIETVFTRDLESHLLKFGQLRNPANSIIKSWTASEKIDGMNIRVVVTLQGITVLGRTDKATIKSDLIAYINSIFNHTKLIEYFTSYLGRELPLGWSVTFYGEGYGAGIQTGKQYSPVKKFRCFDLMLGENWWVDDVEMRQVCADLGIPVAPLLCRLENFPTTVEELWLIIPYSIVAKEDGGMLNYLAEGIVAKPEVVLLDRHGDRIMWKLTFREFK